MRPVFLDVRAQVEVTRLQQAFTGRIGEDKQLF